MYVIKVKGKDLYYSNSGKKFGFYQLKDADVYNTERGAKIAITTLKYWYNVKDSFDKSGYFHPNLRKQLGSLDNIEIKPLKIALK